jgi:hypothetical protein
MKNPPSFGLAVIAAAAGAIASMPAQSGPITVSQTVSLNTLMQQGASSSLQFDLSSFLAGQGFTPAEVVGGQVTVFGFSEASYGAPQADPNSYNQQISQTGSHTGLYSYYVEGYSYCSWWGGCYYSGGYYAWAPYTIYDYTETSDRDIRRTDAVADQMQVSVGATTVSDTASTQSSSEGLYSGLIYDATYYDNCWDGNCSYRTVYHRERNIYSAVYGDLQAVALLDNDALADLRGDGILSVSLGAPVGQFIVNSISFDLLVQHTPTVLSPSASGTPTDVPEPGSLALVGLALAAALGAASLVRRRDGV